MRRLLWYGNGSGNPNSSDNPVCLSVHSIVWHILRTFISPISHYQSNTQTKNRVWLAWNYTHGQARLPRLPVKCHSDVTELIRPGMPEIVSVESSDEGRAEVRSTRTSSIKIHIEAIKSYFPRLFFLWLRQRSLVRLVVSVVDNEATVVASAFFHSWVPISTAWATLSHHWDEGSFWWDFDRLWFPSAKICCLNPQ
jgi:hypothetical protein